MTKHQGKDVWQPRWVIVNQTQSPAFQFLVERLAAELGNGLLVTGNSYGTTCEQLRVKHAPAYNRGTLVQRTVSWLGFAGVAFLELVRLEGRPFVLVVTNPPLLPHLAWLLGRLRRLPYGMLVWDVYPDAIIRMGWAGERGPLSTLWRQLNRVALRDAKVVITIGEHLAASLRDQLGVAACEADIIVIPNWADTEAIHPISKSENPFAIKQGQVDKVTVLYSGNVGAGSGLGQVVEAAALLRDDHRISFLLAGNGLGRDAIAARIGELGLTNVRLLPYQPWEEVPGVLASGDLAVLVQPPGSERISVPSKVYSAMAAGSAILAITWQDSDLVQLVRQHQVGLVCRGQDAHDIANAILRLVDDPEMLQRCRSNARRVAEQHFSVEAAYLRFLDLLRSAMGPADPQCGDGTREPGSSA